MTHASTSRAAIDDGDVQLYHGDVIAVLQSLPAGTVQTCVTSPPYWGLRDYGTGDGQIGLEATPEAYVERMVAVFREVWRVLRDDGTCWINLGSSYAGGGRGGHSDGINGPPPQGAGNHYPASFLRNSRSDKDLVDAFGVHPDFVVDSPDAVPTSQYKPKDMVPIPWMVAMALQADGWYLRGDIIWSKPNPMPESVVDRPTKAHEYLFLLSKRPRYFYDADAIREPHAEERDWPTWEQRKADGAAMRRGDPGQSGDVCHWAGVGGNPSGRNRRSVWTIATEPFPEAHFATYPQELVRPCILAGSREGDTVLDPFIGSGTTALVARKHGRRCIGIDLSAEYLAIAARRLQQLSLFADPVGRSEDTLPEEVA